MNENLRPSTLGEILDRTAQLYRRNFWLFAGVAALPMGTMVTDLAFWAACLSSLFLEWPGATGPGTAMGAALVVIFLVAIPLYLAAYVYSSAGLTEAAVECASRREADDSRHAQKRAAALLALLWYLVLQGIFRADSGLTAGGMIAPPFISRRGPVGAWPRAGIGFVVVVVGAAAIVVIVWLALSYSMGMAACVVERKTAWESLKRSWKLSRGHAAGFS